MQQDLVQTHALVRSAQQGDAQAFTQLVEQHYELMYRFALKFSGHATEAEDITQQACIKLTKSISGFRFESAFSTWLYRMVINCAKDWYKRPALAQTSFLGDEPAVELELNQTHEAETQIQLQQVLKQVASLGDGFHESVVLVLGEGLSHKEAADVLGVKESTISWRLHETRKRLAALEVEQ